MGLGRKFYGRALIIPLSVFLFLITFSFVYSEEGKFKIVFDKIVSKQYKLLEEENILIDDKDFPIIIEFGQKSEIKLEAHAETVGWFGNNNKIPVTFKFVGCSDQICTDNGDGSATVIWDTSIGKQYQPNKIYSTDVIVSVDYKSFNYSETHTIYYELQLHCNSKTKELCVKIPYCTLSGDTCVDNLEIGKQPSNVVKKHLEGEYPVPDNYTGPIPDCAFSGQCRRADDLLELIINIGKFAFSIIGMVAFVGFIYGGFMMIFSFGNADKVKKGRDAMIAAIIGLVIAFGAYALINLILDALNVGVDFRAIND